MIKFNGINHLAMATDDMDMTIHFWRDLIGVRLVAGLGNGKYRYYFFELAPHDMIAFFEWRWPKPEAPISDDAIYPGEGRVFSQACQDSI